MNKMYDVIVAGGGPAGIGAALGAASAGAKVLIVEKTNCLGGVGVSSNLPVFMPGYTDGKRDVIEGVFKDICTKLESMKALVFSHCGTPFDPEMFKFLLDQMMEEKGVDILYLTLLVGAQVEDNKVSGVWLENKSGRTFVKAKQFVDATGDGDLATRAGADFEMDLERGLMPVTSLYTAHGVDIKRFWNKHNEDEGSGDKEHKDFLILYGLGKNQIPEAIENDEYHIPRDALCCVWALPGHDGEVYVHGTRILEVNPTDGWQLSDAEIAGRKQVHELHNFLKKYIKGFENSYISKTGAQIGVRQSRQIIGDYVLTEKDIVSCRQFDDVIAQGTYGIDVHNPQGGGERLEKLDKGTHYDIPYGAVIAKGFDNLFVAGRCISATVEAMGAFRVMPIAMAIGQGAGVAAALCSAQEINSRNLSYDELEKELTRQGVCLK